MSTFELVRLMAAYAVCGVGTVVVAYEYLVADADSNEDEIFIIAVAFFIWPAAVLLGTIAGVGYVIGSGLRWLVRRVHRCR